MPLVDVTIPVDPSFILSRNDSNRPLVISQGNNVYSEEHSLTLRKTSYPIETGASLTDHAFKESDVVKIEGGVMDLKITDTVRWSAPQPTPLGEPDIPYRTAVRSKIRTDEGAAKAAWLEVYQMFQDRALVSLTTTLGRYDNMLITRASVPRDGTTGLDLRFSLTLEEVLVEPITAQPPRVAPPASRSIGVGEEFPTRVARPDPIPTEEEQALAKAQTDILLALDDQIEPNLDLTENLRTEGLVEITGYNPNNSTMRLEVISDNLTYRATLTYLYGTIAEPNLTKGWQMSHTFDEERADIFQRKRPFNYTEVRPFKPHILYPVLSEEQAGVRLGVSFRELYYTTSRLAEGYIISLPVNVATGRSEEPFDRNSFGTSPNAGPYDGDRDRLADQPVDYKIYFISKEDADNIDWPPNVRGVESLDE